MNDKIYDEAKEAYYETLVRRALAEIMQQEADALLPNSSYPALTFSARHEQRIKALFARYRRKRATGYMVRHIRKAAAILLMALGLAFGALLMNPQVRSAVKNLIIHVYERFTLFGFHGGEEDAPLLAQWRPGWLPDGFALESESLFEYYARQIYTNQAGNEIMLLISIDESAVYYSDNTHRTYEKQVFDQIEYYCAHSDTEYGTNQVVWKNGQTNFALESVIGESELLRTAKSIQR